MKYLGYPPVPYLMERGGENLGLGVYFQTEQFYLHHIHFSLHPIREIGCEYDVCVIWGVERK